MYEQSARWNAYYRELDPKRRRAMLDELCMTEPDDGANEYRQLLFAARHSDGRRAEGEVDRMLFACISFVQICQSAKMFRRSAAKEVERTLQQLRYDDAAAYGEAGERALYWEIRNACARYFSTCAASSYNRKVFGLMSSSDDSRLERICRDTWQMSEGLAARTRLEARMALWNRAVLDAYSMTDGGALDRFLRFRREMK